MSVCSRRSGVSSWMSLLLLLASLVIAAVGAENSATDGKDSKDVIPDFGSIVSSGWDKDGVYVLNEDTFDTVLQEKKALLVNFHGNVMPQSREFHPIYTEVVKMLNTSHPEVFSAKVDGMMHRKLANRFTVSSLPTVVLFPHPEDSKFYDYHGPKNAQEIVKWIEGKLRGSALPLHSLEETKALIGNGNVVVIGFFQDLNSVNAVTFKNTIEYVDGIVYGVSGNKDVLNEYAPHGDQIILFKKFDDERQVTFDNSREMSEMNIGIFLMTHMLPDVNTFDWDSVNRYTHKDIQFQLMLYLSRKSPNYASIMQSYKTVGKQYKGKVLCYWVNVDNEALHNMFPVVDLTLQDMPQIRALRFRDGGNKMIKYKPEGIDQPLLLAGMQEFTESVLSGQRQPYYKSEKPAEEFYAKPLKYLVGDEFSKVAFDKEKLVLVYFWAPWCLTCNSTVEGVLTQLATDLAKTHNDIVIAHTDYQKNEYPGFLGEGFPCMWLFLKGDNRQIEFKGKEKFQQLHDFVLSNGEINKDQSEETEQEESKTTEDASAKETTKVEL